MFWIKIMGTSCAIALMKYFWWSVRFGSGNGLVLLSNKPLPESVLTQIYVAIEYWLATKGQRSEI